MFKGAKGTRKALLDYIKRSPEKDVTDWCQRNTPCPEDDRPVVQVARGAPPDVRVRDVPAMGVMPFSLEGKDLSGCVLEYLDMRRLANDPVHRQPLERDVSFAKAVMVRASLRGSAVSRVSFERADMELAVLDSCQLDHCSFVRARLRKASLFSADAESADFHEAHAAGANFTRARLDRADFSDAWLCARDYYESESAQQLLQQQHGGFGGPAFSLGLWCSARLQGASLRGANLMRARLCGADLTGADLSGACLVEADARWCDFAGAKLCGANLSRADLTGARNLDRADLTSAVALAGVTSDEQLSRFRALLTRADVERAARESACDHANFSQADLGGLDLSGGSFCGCSFRSALLHSTNFGRARLSGADFSNAEMSSADLSCARIDDATFVGADMRCACLVGIDVRAARDALLRARNLMGATCSAGTLPPELRARGMREVADSPVFLREPTMASDSHSMLMRRQGEKQRRAAEREAEIAAVEKLEAAMSALPPELQGVRLRILNCVLKERFALGPSHPDDIDDRWTLFSDNVAAFPGARDSPVVKMVYASLVRHDLPDRVVVALWRRTGSIDARSNIQRMGSLESMCIEAMIRKSDWHAWSAGVAKAFTVAIPLAAERAQYIRELFRGGRQDGPGDDSPTSPSASPGFGNISPGPGGGVPRDVLGVLSRSGSEFKPPLSPNVDPLQFLSRTAPAVPGSRSPRKIPGMPLSPIYVSPMPMLSRTAGNSPIQLSPVLVGPPPGPPPPPPPSAAFGMMTPSPPIGMPLNLSPGSLSPLPGVGVMIPLPQLSMPFMPSVPSAPPAFTLTSRFSQFGSPPDVPPPPPPQKREDLGNKVKCVECNMVMDSGFMNYHKRECRLRFVVCSQCKYSMRYVHWDMHNNYCNTIGQCPICNKNVRDNLIVHLYERHMEELIARNFFRGSEPPHKATKRADVWP